MNRFKYVIAALFVCVGCAAQGVEVKKLKINEVDIAYYTQGSGEPLVMVMGFRGTMSLWDPAFIDQLAKHYQVILFDNRGAGLSTDTEQDHTTLEQMAQDTVGVIKALGYEKVHLLGWSMGSMIAMQVAIAHPEVLKTLILCSPNPGGKYYVPHPQADSLKKLASAKLSQEEALRLLFPTTEKGRLAAAEFAARLKEAIHHGSVPDDLNVGHQTVARQIHALILSRSNNLFFEKLASITLPTLVAGGLADVLDSPENVRKVACQIPFAWSAYFPDAGHAFLSQDSIHFSHLIELFITSTKQ
jgi:pimeloyl-ACP methyl ester carboxylesterase